MTDVQAELAEDLRSHLYEEVRSHPGGQHVHWVMNIEWLNECRLLTLREGRFFGGAIPGGEWMLGMMIEVRDDGGIPHLVDD